MPALLKQAVRRPGTDRLRRSWAAALALLVGLLLAPAAASAALQSGPAIQQEIQYRAPDAGEVFLLWGVDGWQTVPEPDLPPGTTLVKGVHYTPMSGQGDLFAITLTVPPNATINYDFHLTRARDGRPIDVWDAGPDGKNFESRATGAAAILVEARPEIAAQISARDFSPGRQLVGLAVLAAGTLLAIGLVRAGRFLLAEASPLTHLLAFALASRAALFGLAYLMVAAAEYKNATNLSFSLAYVRRLVENFSRGDIVQYLGIAVRGYDQRPFSVESQANWAFYPLWPLVLKISSPLFPRLDVWGILLAGAFFLLSVVLLYRLLKHYLPEDAAFLGTVLYLVYPAGQFLTRAGPEALFICLVLGAFLAARHDRWLLVGLLVSLAMVTRLQGVLLLPPLAWLYYRRYRAAGRHAPGVAALALSPLSLLLFFLHLYNLSGHPLAPLAIQITWDNRLTYPFAAMLNFAAQPQIISYYGWDLTPLSTLACLGVTGLSVWALRHGGLPPEFTLFMLLNLLQIVSRDNLNGSLRYLLPVFPIFAGLALVLRKRPVLTGFTLFLFAMLQTFYFLAFAQGFNWAGT